jgi:hypothetical protein
MDTVGWGPRGDSGPVRGRARATQPAIFPVACRSVIGRSNMFRGYGATSGAAAVRDGEGERERGEDSLVQDHGAQ